MREPVAPLKRLTMGYLAAGDYYTLLLYARRTKQHTSHGVAAEYSPNPLQPIELNSSVSA